MDGTEYARRAPSQGRPVAASRTRPPARAAASPGLGWHRRRRHQRCRWRGGTRVRVATQVCSDEDFEIELNYLKVDAGGNIIITQLFYDSEARLCRESL